MHFDDQLPQSDDPQRAAVVPLAALGQLDGVTAPELFLGPGGLRERSVNFTEMQGPDTGANAVRLALATGTITDSDSNTLSNLQITIDTTVAGDVLAYRSSGGTFAYIPLTGAQTTGGFVVGSTVFVWTVNDYGYAKVIDIKSDFGNGPFPRPIADYNTLFQNLYFSNRSDTITGLTNRELSIRVFDEAGSVSSPATVHVSVQGVDDLPTFTAMSGPVATINEDTQYANISFAQIAAVGNEVDLDGSITAFIVKSVTAGSLMVWNPATNNYANWAAGTNDVIDSAHGVLWTPAANANGVMNAFTVVARSDNGQVTQTPVVAQVSVTAVNDAPTLSLSFDGQTRTVTFTEVLGPDTRLNAVPLSGVAQPVADIDSNIAKLEIRMGKPGIFEGDQLLYSPSRLDAASVQPISLMSTGSGELTRSGFSYSFRWTIVESGDLRQLTIESTDANGPAAMPASYYNELLQQLYFNNSSDAPSTTSRELYVSVTDAQGASSAFNALLINVVSTNEAPTLTSITTPFVDVPEDGSRVITFAEVLAASNASDVDGPIAAFRVTGVSGGTLEFFSGGAWKAYDPANGIDKITATTSIRWGIVTDTSGITNAFKVVAVDALGAQSVTSVQVMVNVTPTNDPPTLTTVSSFSHLANRTTTITFADMRAHGDEADVDGIVTGFVVTSLVAGGGGELYIGSSRATATRWDPTLNNLIDPAHNAYWENISYRADRPAGFDVVAVDNEGARSVTPVFVSVVQANAGPTLNLMRGAVSTVAEDTQTLITWSNLIKQGDEQASTDSIIPTFIVKEVTSGILLIRNSAGSVAPWEAGVNDIIDANHSGYWTPAANANGLQDAIKVIVQEASGARSAKLVPVQVSVTAVNDRPVLTQIESPLVTVDEDTQTVVTMATLMTHSNASDVDGTVTAFVVKSVIGTLLIGKTAATATPYKAGTNDVIDATHNAYWTGAANANGVLTGFKVVARDNGGLESVSQINVQIDVTPVNDAPTLTVFTGPVDSTLPGAMVQITYAEIGAKGNEADVDGNVVGFKVTAVPDTGTLRIGTTADLAELWVAGSNDLIDLTHFAFWTPAANASGTPTAFSVVAVDNLGAVSATAVPVQVTVIGSGTSPTGTAGNDSLIGATGNDTLRGLAGNDLLSGLAGDDVLDGGAGNDTLLGGDGSDIYIFLANDHVKAEINDIGTSGIDEARFATTTASTLKFFAVDIGIEKIVIGTGTGAFADSSGIVAAGVNAAALPNGVLIIGNAGSNALVGTSFDDTIIGGAGADVMTGGNGNDTFYVDNVGDKVLDSATNGGIDTVYASVSFTLSTNVEMLYLTGTAANGTGNTSANTIVGNASANVLSGMDGHDTLNGDEGNDTLIGGKGNDMLTGGAGNDVFRFESSPNASSDKDFITDFEQGADRLEFKASVFSAIGAVGALSVDAFWAAPGAVSGHDANDRIIYDTTTGTLYYDADGSGRGASIAVAVIGDLTHPALTAADIRIV